ncbi:MAG: hypothetical protein IKS17_08015 [Firmicutes bacterium]|nr:hypothetical protein [Bacillota bacterium]
MELPIPDMEAVYGIRPRSIIKSKYFYIMTANDGIYRLYPMLCGSAQCGVLACLNEGLCADGTAVCPIVKTLGGESFAELDEQLFMLTRVPAGRAPDINNSADVLKSAALLGRFHRGLRRFPAECDADISVPYKKGLAALKNMKSIINRKNKRSETDKLFLENYAAVLALAENAVDTLDGCGLGCTYAYGTPKEENFIINRDGATLTNWNCPTVSHFLNDVSYFLKRYFKKAERPLLTKDDIMAAYTAQNPLDDAEERALESVLRYPEKYIFVFKEFYGRHRPFAPLYVREKIDRELAALGL